jgi:hypothetical protein
MHNQLLVVICARARRVVHPQSHVRGECVLFDCMHVERFLLRRRQLIDTQL